MVNCFFDSLIMYSEVQCIVPYSSCYSFEHILILFNHHVLISYFVLLQFMCLPARHGNFRLIENAYIVLMVKKKSWWHWSYDNLWRFYMTLVHGIWKPLIN